MGKFDNVTRSRGDLMWRIQQLERQVQELQTARRLESASIGSGGLTVKGGSIVIQDADGEEQMRLSTDGLTLTGLLRILAGLLEWEDDTGNVRMRIGQQGTSLWTDVESVRLIYTDDQGNQRFIVGEIIRDSDGSLMGHGLLVQDADGQDNLRVLGGQGRVLLGADDDDEIDLYDGTGTFRATLGPVNWAGEPDGYGLFIEAADGLDRLFVSDNRIWLRTTDGQIGEVTAGDVDSGGTGFRLLRIPN